MLREKEKEEWSEGEREEVEGREEEREREGEERLKKYACEKKRVHSDSYGVATVSRIDKIIGLFCR